MDNIFVSNDPLDLVPGTDVEIDNGIGYPNPNDQFQQSIEDSQKEGNVDSTEKSPYTSLIDRANQLQKNLGYNAFSSFVNSPAFKSAYDAFSKGPDSDVWISRLFSIAYSIPESTWSFWDQIRESFAGSWTKEQQQYESAAHTELNKLISEWQAFINSLPATQRQQYADAGLNVALDGGAQLSGSTVSPSNSSGIVDPGLSNQIFDNALNFVTAISGGLLDLISQVNNVFSGVQSRKIQKEGLAQTGATSVQNLNLQRMQLGLNPISDISQPDSRKDIGVSTLIDSGFYKKVKESYGEQFAALVQQSIYENLGFSQQREGQFAAYADITQNLGQIYFGNMLYDQMAQYERNKFIYENIQKTNQMALDSQETAFNLQKFDLNLKRSQFKESSSLNEFHKKLIDYKRAVLSNWIEEAGSDNPNAWLYASLLMKSNFDMTEFMSPTDVGFEYGKNVTDIVGSFFPKFSLSKKKGK